MRIRGDSVFSIRAMDHAKAQVEPGGDCNQLGSKNAIRRLTT
jgi:hypothetical protein